MEPRLKTGMKSKASPRNLPTNAKDPIALTANSSTEAAALYAPSTNDLTYLDTTLVVPLTIWFIVYHAKCAKKYTLARPKEHSERELVNTSLQYVGKRNTWS